MCGWNPELEIVNVVRQLRGENGCPWNASQTADQLSKALEAEVAELSVALRSGAVWQIQEELGDIFFNLIALTEVYRERELFDLHKIDQLASIKFKLRHPYVFGVEEDPGPELAELEWKKMKDKEIDVRFQSRIGIMFGYSLREIREIYFTDVNRLKNCTVELAKEYGIIELNSVHTTHDFSAKNKDFYFTICGKAPNYLILQALFTSKLIMIQGFSTQNIEPTENYNKLIDLFGTDNIEATLIECGHKQLDLDEGCKTL